MNNNSRKETVILTDHIHRTDLDLFVGRYRELTFLEEMASIDQPYRVINLYGIAGVGKTLLLTKLKEQLSYFDGEIIYLDCRQLEKIPNLFSKGLIEVLKDIHPQNNSIDFEQFPRDRNLIFAIDHYDEGKYVEEWIRDRVMTEIPEQVMVILSGKNPLRDKWIASPAWNELIHPIELKRLSFMDVKNYVAFRGVYDSDTIYKLWNVTKGHPLALSLYTSRVIEQGDQDIAEQHDLVQYLAQNFLHEIMTDTSVRSLIEYAAILHYFDEEKLSYVSQQTISTIPFDRVIETSFVKQGKSGWYLDELVRSMMNQFFKYRNGKYYDDISKRCAAYYRYKIFSNSNREHLLSYITEYIYHLGDHVISATIFDQSSPHQYSLVTADEGNFSEVENYFYQRKQHTLKYEVDYYNIKTDDKYQFKVSSEHNEKENELIDLPTLKNLGCDIFKILKDEKGETIGISIVIPINRKTLPYLKELPVSRSYFNRLTRAELAEYQVDESELSGWFIRMIDVVDPEDPAKRSHLLYSLMPLLLTGGRIITSTPLKMYQEILKRFGFSQIKGATHFDYGPNVPTPTYLLDVRGPRLIGFLDQLAKQLEQQNSLELPKTTLPFSPREFEVAELIMEGCTNDEIASKLSVSQITVKKHVSNLFKKAEVKNRAQLVRRLLDHVKGKN